MKFKIGVLFIAGTMMLSACGTANDTSSGDGNGLNPTVDTKDKAGYPGKTKQEAMDDYGYTRIQSPLGKGRRPVGDAAQIDRKQLSDIITRIVMQSEDVKDAATLVTSKEVLIVYQTSAEDRNKMADIVKRSALSVVPRWYHVYVSDDTTLFDYIERYKNLDDNTANVGTSIEALIKEMKKSPQGKRLSEGEDENGLQEGEMDYNMDKGKTK